MPKMKLPRTLYRHANFRADLLFDMTTSTSRSLNKIESDSDQSNFPLINQTNNIVEHELEACSINNSVNNPISDDEHCSIIVSDVDSDSDLDANCQPNFESSANLANGEPDSPVNNFHMELAVWAVKNQIKHNALNGLLSLLNTTFKLNLPVDSRTLLKTPRAVTLTFIEPGQYYHFGLDIALNNLLQKYKGINDLTSIDVFINIDGLPIAKSTGSQLYPILCSLQDKLSAVEVIGLYHGLEKPKDANSYLKQFINEAVFLTENGFEYNGRLLPFKIMAFICDTPAKSFISYTKGHTGYYSCSKCCIKGDFIENRTCFPATDNLKYRTHCEFKLKVDKEHHTGTSLIESLPGFDMITDIPLDYMHLICLGVMRKLLLFWIFGKPPTKLCYRKIINLSTLLIEQGKNIPCEFARKPRSVIELKRWKATELRQFLFYTGPVVLMSILTPDMFLNFLCFHVASTILSSTKYLNEFGQYAHSLYKYFIQSFITLYGIQHVSHNVHNLLHIYDDTKKFGVLQKFSSFPFENYLQTFKSLLRKGDKPLSQIINRIVEKQTCGTIIQSHVSNFIKAQPSGEHSSGPVIDDRFFVQYKVVAFEEFTLKVLEGDDCCCLVDNSVIWIKNFVSNDKGLFLIGCKFQLLENLYVKPCNSSDLGVFKVSRPGPLDIWSVNQIAYKFVKLSLKDKFVIIPLLHTNKH